MKSSNKIQAFTMGTIIILILFMAPDALCSQDQPQVTDLIVHPDTNEVELTVQGPIEYGYFPLSDPERIVFDFPGAILNYQDGNVISRGVDGACFDSIRMSQFSQDPPITRLVLFLNQTASAAVSFSPASDQLVIQVIPDQLSTDRPASEPIFEEEIPTISTGTDPPAITHENYEITSDRSEVTLRIPGLSEDAIEIDQLRYPDRLHIRLLTGGTIDGTRPRFNQLDAGNIWNDVAKQWRSYTDRDGLGVIDITMYLYPGVGYTRSIGPDGTTEIILSALPHDMLETNNTGTIVPAVDSTPRPIGTQDNLLAIDEDETPVTARTTEPIYDIAFNRTEVTVRVPGLTADNITVNQLRFPDRLYIRMLTAGPIDDARPRFNQLEAGNIWNNIAKQWRSYADRDGLGVIDLTIYTYPNTGFTQSIGSDGVPEIRIFPLPCETTPVIIEDSLPSVEIEVDSFNDETELVEVEVLAETTSDEPVIAEIETIIETPEVTETLEIIENGVFIASAGSQPELGPIIEPAASSIAASAIPDIPLALGRNDLLTTMSTDSGIIVMRVGDVVVVPTSNLVRASIGNPLVATVNVYSKDEVLVTALGAGNTTLLTWEDEDGHISREVWVYEATAAQEEEIEALIGDGDISVTLVMAGGVPGVVLEGSVETEEEMLRAGAISALFAGEERVTNLIEVTDPRQVLVKVRVVEIDKRAMDEHLSQINASARTDNDDFTIGIITDLLDPENPGGGLLNNRIRPGIINGEADDMVYDPIDIMLRELESLRQATILSEPNLVSLSGHPAFFRVGGEVPYTYLNQEGVNVVEFKEFGIQVEMTPLVDSQGNIFMNIAPTVRTVDMALAIAGIPGFRTREITTDVQLKDGDTLVIGGLIQHEITEIVSEVPFLCDIPILGQLFRSKRFNEDETELVIFITPYILNGTNSEELIGVYIDHPGLEGRE